MIKLKSYIYRYTGLYLAHKEELQYTDSREFWNEFDKIRDDPENDLSSNCIAGILIGSWQVKHKFYRKYTNRSNNIVNRLLRLARKKK